MAAKVVPWLVVVLLGLTLKVVYDGRRRAEGREAVLIAENAHLQDTLTKVSQRRDVQYVRDTITKWRTVRKTVTLLDTLLKSDTVTLTRRESVIVFAADSAITACRSVVTSCEARVAVRDSLLSAVRVERDLWKRKSTPSLLTRLSTAGKWLTIGLLIGAAR